MARKGDNSFYVVNRPTLKYLLLFLHLTPISGSFSSDFAYPLYPSVIVKKLKIEFSQKALDGFF